MGRKKKDRQAKRVYEWQWSWRDWNRATLPLDKITKIINHSSKMWRVFPPNKVSRMPRRKDYSAYNEKYRVIRLLPQHMNMPMALHEVAHHIKDARFGTGGQDHGPLWLGIFVDLLVDWKVAPREAIEASLKARGLKWHPVDSVNKKAS